MSQRSYASSVTEAILKSLLQEVGPKNFSIALHNASSHGDVFKENYSEYLDDEDKFLTSWYEGLDQLNKAAK